ncbi:MAG: phosphomannomutase/phosphoglucomutase [Candidatus Woesearchaeota archaeon]
MGGIFKAYDIRGIYPNQLDSELIFNIGRAYAEILKKKLSKDKITIVVGKDMRLSSPELSESLKKGITTQGVDVIDIGLSSTPTFYYAVSFLGADGGMQVSASHNPKEYNGVKIVGEKAYPVGYDTGINTIEEMALAGEFPESQKEGAVENKEGILDSEVEFALKHGKPDAIKKMKIVCDTANAMGSPYLEKLFGNLSCELVKMNFELDGTFPAHLADPFQEENVADLKKRVLDENADLGIATDGDGDRIFFIDDKGSFVEPAIIRGILAEIMLKENPGAKVCYDIRPGKITRDMIEQNGGTPVVTRVGHSLIKQKAIEEGAVFAGESSGHFFFNYSEIGVFEMPMIVVLKLLEYVSEKGKPFSEIIAPLRKYSHSGEINFKVENKQEVMDKVKESYPDAKISDLDGITIEYDSWWFNIRASNTEPLLRLNLEANDENIMKEKVSEVKELIDKFSS